MTSFPESGDPSFIGSRTSGDVARSVTLAAPGADSSGAYSAQGGDARGLDSDHRVTGSVTERQGAGLLTRGRSQDRGGSIPPASVCKQARKAVRWYRAVIRDHAHKMGAGDPFRSGSVRTSGQPNSGDRGKLPSGVTACPRHLAHVLRRKAQAARIRYEAWWEYHWHWQAWLPDKWARLGACETGYGRWPGDWTWDSGQYVSAFGIYRPGYADDAHRIGALSWDETIRKLHRLPTPREQFKAALSHYRAHEGFSGWGCRGA